MAIKLGDIARTLGIELIRGGQFVGSAVGQAAGFWGKQIRDNALARSYYSPYPLTHIHEGGLTEFIEKQRARGVEYERVAIHVESPIGGSNVNYKRLISQEVERAVPHSHGRVTAVFLSEKYEGKRGNKSFDAVALIPKKAKGVAFAGQFAEGYTAREFIGDYLQASPEDFVQVTIPPIKNDAFMGREIYKRLPGDVNGINPKQIMRDYAKLPSKVRQTIESDPKLTPTFVYKGGAQAQGILLIPIGLQEIISRYNSGRH